MNQPLVNLLDPLALGLKGAVLIEASAGTGKTFTITTLVARLVARGVPIESILVVTFTEAAAAELKLRIRDRLARCFRDSEDELSRFFAGQEAPERIEKRLALAVAGFDRAAVMTIHSFCFSILRENAFESGTFFDMALLAENVSFFRQTVMDFFGTRINSQDEVCLSFLQQAGVTPETFERDFFKAAGKPKLRVRPSEAVFRAVGDSYRATVDALAKLLSRERDGIESLILNHPGIDKRSYSKRYVPAWLDKCQDLLTQARRGTVFHLNEKGDPLYKFTRERLAEKTRPGFDPPSHAFFDRCEDLLDFSRVLAENLVRLRMDFLDFYQQALETMKQTRAACFFDDLINDLWTALERDGAGVLTSAVLARYQACLIDEFQDTDPVQYRIFSTLFAADQGFPFFMIGDPKQAIYAFRGGDIYAYLDAGRSAGARFTLGRNFRSAPALVRGVNHLFSRLPEPFGFSEIPFYPVGVPESAIDRYLEGGQAAPPLQIAFLGRAGFALDRSERITKADALARVPGILARDLLALLGDPDVQLRNRDGSQRPAGPGDMAVLVRTNAQAEAVYQALTHCRIPCYLAKTGSVFDSPEALEMVDLLAAVNAPENLGLVKAALASSLFGADAAFLVRMDREPAFLDLWQEWFLGLHRLWTTQGFLAVMNQILYGRDTALRPGTACSERALTNFFHLTELISRAAVEKSLTPEFLLNWCQRQLDPSTRVQGADELRLESDEEAVAIVTVHKSKGLEYPMVFLPFLWDWKRGQRKGGTAVFHDPDAGFELTFDLGSPGLETAQELAAQEQAAEEMRLLYVALTRASALCRIYWAGVAGCDQTALGRFFHPAGAGDDRAMQDDIRQLASGSKESLALTFPAEHPGEWRSAEPRSGTLVARAFDRTVLPKWRITSYSGLAAGQSHREETLPLPGNLPADGIPAGVPSAEPDRPGSGDERFFWEETLETREASDGILLETFPKGAGAGDFFHHVLETVAFSDPTTIAPAVAAGLDRYGFSREKYGAVAEKAVARILETPLPGEKDTFALNQVGDAWRFTELAFCFALTRWDLAGLAALFEAEPDAGIRAYAGRLRQMNIPDFNGFLKGFIDLVVCRDNRWYILDYKSNFLGPRYSDYHPDAMARAMVSHDYLLQFHLYLVALDRYLARRLAHYDYDTHFGGGFYLFIRGMAPGQETGIFFHRPSSGFMAGLRQLL